MFSRTIPINKKTEKVSSHQKLVRAARRAIVPYLPDGVGFPSAAQIINFEGKNGPDGLLDKHGAFDMPEDFVDLNDPTDRVLFEQIKNHIHNLHVALKKDNAVRAEFEAAWLEHFVVDGLTPAHHRPLKVRPQKTNTRGNRSNVLSAAKLYWKAFGPGGDVGMGHMAFEAGIEFIIMPMSPSKLAEVKITDDELEKIKSGKFIELYEKSIRKIDTYKMFQRYKESFWTNKLAFEVRKVLIPEAVRMVALAWLTAVYKGKGKS